MPGVKAESPSTWKEPLEFSPAEERQRRVILIIARRDPEHPSKPLFPIINFELRQGLLQDYAQNGITPERELYLATIVNDRDNFLDALDLSKRKRPRSREVAEAIVEEVRLLSGRAWSIDEIKALVSIGDDKRKTARPNGSNLYSSRYSGPANATLERFRTPVASSGEQIVFISKDFWENWRLAEAARDMSPLGSPTKSKEVDLEKLGE